MAGAGAVHRRVIGAGSLIEWVEYKWQIFVRNNESIYTQYMIIWTHQNEHGERTRTHLPKDAVLQARGEDVNAVLLGILREPGLAGLVRSSPNGNEESGHREDGYEETEEGRHGQAVADKNGAMRASKSFLRNGNLEFYLCCFCEDLFTCAAWLLSL